MVRELMLSLGLVDASAKTLLKVELPILLRSLAKPWAVMPTLHAFVAADNILHTWLCNLTVVLTHGAHDKLFICVGIPAVQCTSHHQANPLSC